MSRVQEASYKCDACGNAMKASYIGQGRPDGFDISIHDNRKNKTFDFYLGEACSTRCVGRLARMLADKHDPLPSSQPNDGHPYR